MKEKTSMMIKNTNTENDCKTYKKLKTEKTEQSAVVREMKMVC